MSGPVTEICFLPLLSGTKLEDPDSDDSRVLQTALSTLEDQDGFQKAYYGRQIEDPEILQLHVDWDSINAHTAFTRSSAYKPFSKHLSAILLDPPRYYHARFSHPFEHAAGAAVTELATFHFDGAPDTAAFDENAARFAETLRSSAEGLRDVSMGWAVEEVEHPELEGGRGKAFVLAIGWTGVDAHMAYRETEAFKNSVHLLREGPKASEMHHVSFTTHVKIT